MTPEPTRIVREQPWQVRDVAAFSVVTLLVTFDLTHKVCRKSGKLASACS